MKIQTLRDCFVTKVMALYDVETQLVKAIPKMIKNAENEKLQKGLADHLGETEGHVERLETIFEQLDMAPKKLKVEAIRGLIDDASWCMEQDTTSATLDSMIIASASYIEHYEIAGYTSLLAWAKLLGLEEAETLIEQTLDEETNANDSLGEAAQEVNDEANVSPDEDEEESEEEMTEEA